MGSIALSRTLQGGLSGLDRGMARRDMEAQRNRADVQFQQGQDDRNYALKRRGITDARSDAQYGIQKRSQDRLTAGQAAMNAFMSGDLESPVEFMNEYTQNGVTFSDLKGSEKDGYTYTLTQEGKEPITETVSKDDIGKILWTTAHNNSLDQYKEDSAQDRADDQAATERANTVLDRNAGYANDKNKIVAKGAQDRLTDAAKVTLDRESGSSATDAEGKVPGYEKEIEKTSAKVYGGKLENGMLIFPDENSEGKYFMHRDLSRAIYNAQSGDKSVSKSDRKTRRLMNGIEAKALAQAKKEQKDGAIAEDSDTLNARTVELMDAYVDMEIKKVGPAADVQLQRGVQGTKEPDNLLKGAADEYRKRIKGASPEEIEKEREMLDKYYPGLADEIEKSSSGKSGLDEVAPKSEPGVSVIGDAAASEAEPVKPKSVKKDIKLSRDKKAVKPKKDEISVSLGGKSRTSGFSRKSSPVQKRDDKQLVDWINSINEKAASPGDKNRLRIYRNRAAKRVKEALKNGNEITSRVILNAALKSGNISNNQAKKIKESLN